MVSYYEMLTQASEFFPEILASHRRLPGSGCAKLHEDAEVRHRCDRMFSQLHIAAGAAKDDVSYFQTVHELLERYISFCKLNLADVRRISVT